MMSVGRFEFRPRLWPTVAAAATVALMIHLGLWQVGRAEEKQRLQERYDVRAREPAVAMPESPVSAEDYRFRRVEVEGVFDPRSMILVDNRVRRGRVGYEVVTALRLGAGPMHVLVNRGWVAAGPTREDLPVVPTPAGRVRLEGVAVVPTEKILELSETTREGSVWENLVLERYRAAFPFQIQPVVLQQTSAADDGLLREWERPDTGVVKHQARAFTWFVIGAVVFGLWIGLNVRRRGQEG